METFYTADDIEARAAAAGKPMVKVCNEAGIAPSTFYRWKLGRTSPALETYRKLILATAPTTEAAQ